MITDVFGKLLIVGDKVAYITKGRRQMLTLGVIAKLTPKGATMCNGDNKAANQIVKAPKEEMIWQ